MAHGALDAAQILFWRMRLDRTDDAAGHDEAESVNGVRRVGRDDHIARRRDRLRKIGEAFFGTQRRNDLGVGIELYAKAAVVIAGHGAAQSGNAARRGVTIGARLSGRLTELVDDMLRHGQVGVAHAEIDDVDTLPAQTRLQLIDLLEHIRRQATDLVELGRTHERTPGAISTGCAQRAWLRDRGALHPGTPEGPLASQDLARADWLAPSRAPAAGLLLLNASAWRWCWQRSRPPVLPEGSESLRRRPRPGFRRRECSRTRREQSPAL